MLTASLLSHGSEDQAQLSDAALDAHGAQAVWCLAILQLEPDRTLPDMDGIRADAFHPWNVTLFFDDDAAHISSVAEPQWHFLTNPPLINTRSKSATAGDSGDTGADAEASSIYDRSPLPGLALTRHQHRCRTQQPF